MNKISLQGTISFTIALTLFLLACAPTLMSAPTLPKFGFSLSSNGDIAQIGRAAAACGLKDALVILPPVSISLGAGESQSAPSEALEKLITQMPEGLRFLIRLRIQTGGFTKTGKELEGIITERITEAIKRLPLGNPAISGLIVETEGPLPSPELLQFSLANIAIKAKAGKENLQIVFSFPRGFIEEHGDLVKKLASYYDALAPVFTPNWPRNQVWITEQAFNKPVYLKLAFDGSSNPKQMAVSYLDAALAVAGTSVNVLWIEQPDLEVLNRLCSATNLLSQSLGSESTIIDSRLSPFTVTVERSERSEYKVFTDIGSRNVGIMVRVEAADKLKTVLLHGPSGGQFEIKWYDIIANAPLTPNEIKKDEKGTVQACMPGSEYTFVFIRNLAPPGSQLHSAVEVTARADLTVEEVIARWQEYKESQRQILDSYTADCFMNLHFEPTNFGSGFDISMSFKQFWNRDGLVEWVQSGFYVNGVRFNSKREFPLPQLEPERVMTQPLELKLNEKYTYKLHGVDQVNGQFCYVVGVEPKELTETLYSGKIWIEGTKFRQVKMELRQRGIKSNVIANVETQNFELISDGTGNEFNLIKSIYAQQTLNAAGRNFLLEKTYDFSGYAINRIDFAPSLAAARSSDSPIYRDTDTGLNVLRKEGDKRVLVERNKRVKSIIAGVLYEGSLDYPIPLAGVSLVNFNFLNTGSQLSVFFAGPILAANLSKQWKGQFRLGMDLALSALPENNRIYSGNTELKNEGIWVFEETTGVRASWQATTSLSFTGALHLSYNYFRSTSDTDKQFILPRNGITLIPSFELKYARNGYMLTAGGSDTKRIGWKDFGFAQSTPSLKRNQFDKYYADFSKYFYYGKFMKTGLDLSYYGGDKLDRFSRYRPSFLGRPRIKGIPSGTDSFDDIGLASMSHGFNLFDLIKFEGSYNHAWARNKAESNHFRGFDGLEFDFGTAGPWGTYLQGTVTYALAGNLERYNSRWGVYFLIFRPLH